MGTFSNMYIYREHVEHFTLQDTQSNSVISITYRLDLIESGPVSVATLL